MAKENPSIQFQKPVIPETLGPELVDFFDSVFDAIELLTIDVINPVTKNRDGTPLPGILRRVVLVSTASTGMSASLIDQVGNVSSLEIKIRPTTSTFVTTDFTVGDIVPIFKDENGVFYPAFFPISFPV